ncbi:hypothetical protein T265_04019 [Opisthorchis viverrini]|uniref:Uncharacterized protein n=1 Tax=Opisthorchis viverrini TaxID=6198 RepID=A0A074ZQH2_OPIVI|nr:hypothetical protein T265_04019 [Opisthorchis viverrini]KER29366.1 hypothetical protein T265_04019 [Opisthorchis viverrini]
MFSGKQILTRLDIFIFKIQQSRYLCPSDGKCTQATIGGKKARKSYGPGAINTMPKELNISRTENSLDRTKLDSTQPKSLERLAQVN